MCCPRALWAKLLVVFACNAGWLSLATKIIRIQCTVLLITHCRYLQPFLESEFHLDTVATGALMMVDGLTYALFTPFWGWVLDAGHLGPLQSLSIGNLCIIVGYSLLGPAPFLFFIPSTVYMVGIGMAIYG